MKRKFTLKLDLDNDAFYPDPVPEVARILRQTAESVEDGVTYKSQTLYDVNGNDVGRYLLTFDE